MLAQTLSDIFGAMSPRIWFFYIFAGAYAAITVCTLAHCLVRCPRHERWRHALAIVIIPFFGAIFYWRNRPDLEDLHTPVLGAGWQPSLKLLDKYSSPPPPARVIRYSSRPPFEINSNPDDAARDNRHVV